MNDLLPVPLIDDLPDMPWTDKLAYLAFKFSLMPQVECPLEHSFDDGNYIRTIQIPRGTLFVGRIHRLGHLVELLTGSVLHVREHCRRLVHAPFSLTTSPGDQVCALTLTDISARTVHPAHGCTDIDELEKTFFETTESLCLAGQAVEELMRRRLYERDSSGGSWGGGSWGGRYLNSRI